MGKGMNDVQPIRDKVKIQEMKDVLRQKSKRDYFLFTLGINLGLRISDLLKLKVYNVKDQSHVVLNEKKTRKKNRIYIENEHLQKEIKQYIKGKNNEDYLFPSRKGDKAISSVQAYRILNRAAEEIGLVKRDNQEHIISGEIGTHSLRKSYGYHFYQATKDVATLQEQFNHSSPAVTKKYIGISQDELDNSRRNFFL